MKLAQRVIDVAWLLALALWTGGLVTLGAVVAPLVFGIVAAPTSGDAMTAVFARFDRVACACALVALLCEAARAVTRRPLSRVDVARASFASIAAGLAILESVAVTPRIAALHAAGAVRGMGAAGEALDTLHHLAESLAKAELGALVIALALFAGASHGTQGKLPHFK